MRGGQHPTRLLHGVLGGGVPRTATEKETSRPPIAARAKALLPRTSAGQRDSAPSAVQRDQPRPTQSSPTREKRKKYDRWGHNWEKIDQAQSAGAGYGGRTPGRTTWTSAGDGAPAGFNVESDDLGGLFEQLFGRTAGRTRVRSAPRKGADTEQPVEITLEEAFNGTQRTFQLRDMNTGETHTVEVKIPVGATDGLRVRVAGKGEPGLAGAPGGDLYLIISIKAHPLFERDGDDLRVKVPTPLYSAMLGGEVMVPTPKGSQLALKVPPETPNGQRIRLTGQGMPRVTGTGRGDLYAEITVQLPTSLSQREKELFAELAAARD